LIWWRRDNYLQKADVVSGNKAVAIGVKLSRVKGIAAYPITPQSAIVEYLAEFVSKGEMDAVYIPVESEHSALTAVMGMELAGIRSFTASCSQGLAYMHEVVADVPGYRLPIVMAVTNRTLGQLWGLHADYSDIMPEKDLGWIQIFVEGVQECLDTVIQAYRIAEDKRVLLPVMVNLDGFYLSHASEPVLIPQQEDVDDFLPPYTADHIILDPTTRFQTLGMRSPGPQYHITFVRLIEEAMNRAKEVIVEVDDEFSERFGRSYGGLVEGYKCEDAEVLLITMGSMTTAARRAVDELRRMKLPVGLVKLRVLRPFPRKEIQKIAKHVSAIGVVDRAFAFGTNKGMVFSDVAASLYHLDEHPLLLNFIAGLGGKDVTINDFKYMFEKALQATKSKDKEEVEETIFLEDWEAIKRLSSPPKPPVVVQGRLLQPGGDFCAGCGIPLIVRHILEVLGENTIIVRTSSCFGAGIQSPPLFVSLLGVPLIRSCLAAGAAMASGIALGLRARRRPHVNVVAFVGDGGTADIGLQSLSGAAERNDPIIYICYDNEGYMNTGVQRSSTTMISAWTTTTPVSELARGKREWPKDMVSIMLAHKVPYIATASIAYITDFKRKVKRASEITQAGEGLAYIQVHTPCPTGWGFPENKTIEVARLAVETGMVPLLEIYKGKLEINVKLRELKPVSEYLKIQRRFRHLTASEIARIQDFVNRRARELGIIQGN
jgi:pyruvate ferredoxin oxidoreductase alpha subunit